MEFVNQFVVPAPVEQAWALLTDVPRIAPCLPGATVQELADGTLEGTVAVKVGPIKVSYGGAASFTTLDPKTRTMVLDAKGKEQSGKGSVAAVVHVDLAEQGPASTQVQVVTELQVTGKVAQFGRSAMADVGERLIGQFAANLERLLNADPDTLPSASAGSAEASAGPVRRASETPAGAAPARPAGAELNVLSLAVPLLTRAAPSVGALLVGLLLGRLLGGSRPRPSLRGRGFRQLVRSGHALPSPLPGTGHVLWCTSLPSGEASAQRCTAV